MYVKETTSLRFMDFNTFEYARLSLIMVSFCNNILNYNTFYEGLFETLDKKKKCLNYLSILIYYKKTVIS